MKKTIYRFCLCVLTVFMAFSMTACELLSALLEGYEVTKAGLDNFHYEESPYETTRFMIPSIDFLQLYPYVNGDYDYHEILDNYAYETAFLY